MSDRHTDHDDRNYQPEKTRWTKPEFADISLVSSTLNGSIYVADAATSTS